MIALKDSSRWLRRPLPAPDFDKILVSMYVTGIINIKHLRGSSVTSAGGTGLTGFTGLTGLTGLPDLIGLISRRRMVMLIPEFGTSSGASVYGELPEGWESQRTLGSLEDLQVDYRIRPGS
jgi:hypothetical protein